VGNLQLSHSNLGKVHVEREKGEEGRRRKKEREADIPHGVFNGSTPFGNSEECQR